MLVWWVMGLAVAGGAAFSCSETDYLSNGALLERLEALATDHPDLAFTYSIGLSATGVELRVLKLSAAPEEAGVPQVKLVGAIHGNEPPSSQLLLTFAEYLVSGYREGERTVVWLLNNTRIHILPRLNPDGFSVAIEGECSLGPGRRNANDMDLNNCFPTTEDGEPAELQPEVEAVIGWLAVERFALSASFHTGSLVAVYPLDFPAGARASARTPDDPVFRHLARTYASSHRSMASGVSCRDAHFPGGIINGANWYPKKGTMMDYNYLYAGTMELTFEIACCKYPPPRELCYIWESNRLALLKLVMEATGGVRGTVSSGGIPLERAVVSVRGRDMHVFTDDRGRFYRILLPGKYSLLVEMVGMVRREVEVEVPGREGARPSWADIQVELVPELADPLEPLDPGGLDPDHLPATSEEASLTASTGLDRWEVTVEDETSVEPEEWPSTAASEHPDPTLLTRKVIFGAGGRVATSPLLLLAPALLALRPPPQPLL